MKFFSSLYAFLGGVRFAIILIASVALFVIAGTFIEAKTESHLYASLFTYNNPVFLLLLWGFFINILFASLRRWPFHFSHIPFLITHLGLLMILGGTLIKGYYGLQGSIGLIEGSGSEEVFLPHTMALRIDSHSGETKYLALNNLSEESNFPHLKLVEYVPHSKEYYETWIKGNQAYINGLKSFPVYITGQSPLLPSTRVRFSHLEEEPWDVFAIHTKEPFAEAEKLYLQGLELILSDRISGNIVFNGKLKDALSTSIALPIGIVTPRLSFSKEPVLTVDIQWNHQTLPERITIPLSGPLSITNLNLDTPDWGSVPLTADLRRKSPVLAMLQDEEHNTMVFAYDHYGRIFHEQFLCTNPDTVIVYDKGYGGYTVNCQVSFPKGSREGHEQVIKRTLQQQLKEAIDNKIKLSPPLDLLYQACQKANVDFPSCCVEYLCLCDHSHTWVFDDLKQCSSSLQKALSSIDWKRIPSQEKRACQWICALFSCLEPEVKAGTDFGQALRERGWPLSSDPQPSPTLFAQQIFALADQLPSQKQKFSNSALLSAFMRVYEIRMQEISKEITQTVDKPLTLECPLSVRYCPLTPITKLEDLAPCITLEAHEGSKTQTISLGFDRYGQGLKWPILNGQYLLRFQPQFVTIPYRVRLRQARQISYPHSTQPYSYEADLIITDNKQGKITETTLSMNHVHETWDGYRFYLASMSPDDESAAKRVQIVVNHDPAKYWLTYPGAVILTVGIVLLFWQRK